MRYILLLLLLQSLQMPPLMRTQVIKNFLNASTHPDLAGLYNHDMEVQVNVAQDTGERVEGEYKGRSFYAFTDGVTTWRNFRIPHNAYADPSYDDSPLAWDLAAHVEGIGLTGWDWHNCCSKWVGFDFDAITGHSERHAGKLTNAELNEIEQKVQGLDWVTVRRSTSGNGLHLYVFLPDIPTTNHTEHQALGRSVLGFMSGMLNFDFKAKVDAVGGILWIWHRKMLNTEGLKLLKQGSMLYDYPSNWRDHIKVVSGVRRKTLPTFIEESNIPDAERLFEELTGQRTRTNLDADHHKLLTWLRENECAAYWDNDHYMLVTHTIHLREAHEALGFKGAFKTDSTHSSDINCFAFPLRKGAWVIRRYTPGVKEDSSWDIDASGWTRTFYNRDPDLHSAARSHGGLEHPAGGFHFREAEQAQKAALELGADLALPPFILSRTTRLKTHKDGRLIVEIIQESTDNPEKMIGWISEGKYWKKVFNVQSVLPTASEVGNYDDIVRHLVTINDDDFGWVLKTDNTWRTEPWVHIKTALRAFGLIEKDVIGLLGSSVFRPWIMVNKPFENEYPGGREWNRGAAQLRYTPSANRDTLYFPTWTKILTHIGHGLDSAIKQNTWARNSGILSGAAYLKCWIASLFQEPQQPLPYLFLYSPEQAAGKSIFHEALSLLITRGVARADIALVSQSGFNAELERAVLCIVEETDLRHNRSAYGKIKDWITSRDIVIHRKGETPYTIPNTTHWCQFSNDAASCPIFPGDTRITVIRVPPLDAIEIIPKKILLPRLEKEAPDFLAEMMHFEIPPSDDRLNVPVIITDEKLSIVESNQTMLEIFLKDNTYHVTGETITIAEFFDRFQEWIEPQYIHEWTKIKISREMPPHFCKGRNNKAAWCYGNISWTPRSPDTPIKPKLIVIGEMLVSER